MRELLAQGRARAWPWELVDVDAKCWSNDRCMDRWKSSLPSKRARLTPPPDTTAADSDVDAAYELQLGPIYASASGYAMPTIVTQ